MCYTYDGIEMIAKEQASHFKAPIIDSGRVTIPAEKRHEQGIQVGDIVNATITKNNASKRFTAYVGGEGKFTIPWTVRKLLDLKIGEHIDVEISLEYSPLAEANNGLKAEVDYNEIEMEVEVESVKEADG
jgi:bifunctional DNA-binding transcriptional regulator/antitoxin component of YhaV-PrlF toxin-antitoxin module